MRFVDTNVLLYAISKDPGERRKTDIAMGCDTLLSEDLSDGQSYAGVRVRNPFRAASRRKT